MISCVESEISPGSHTVCTAKYFKHIAGEAVSAGMSGSADHVVAAIGQCFNAPGGTRHKEIACFDNLLQTCLNTAN